MNGRNEPPDTGQHVKPLRQAAKVKRLRGGHIRRPDVGVIPGWFVEEKDLPERLLAADNGFQVMAVENLLAGFPEIVGLGVEVIVKARFSQFHQRRQPGCRGQRVAVQRAVDLCIVAVTPPCRVGEIDDLGFSGHRAQRGAAAGDLAVGGDIRGDAEIFLAAAIGEAERLSRDEERTFIHPFEGFYTTLGAAGVGLEIINALPDLEAAVVSVGGGGLISGVAAGIKLVNPNCKIYGVEPEGADSVSKSLAAGKPVTLDKVDTIADSLGPPFSLPFGLSVIRQFVDDVVTITDDEILAGLVVLQEEGKLAVEPAAGAAMAAALGPLRERLQGKRTAILICGANIDAETYTTLHERGQPHVAALMAD